MRPPSWYLEGSGDDPQFLQFTPGTTLFSPTLFSPYQNYSTAYGREDGHPIPILKKIIFLLQSAVGENYPNLILG